MGHEVEWVQSVCLSHTCHLNPYPSCKVESLVIPILWSQVLTLVTIAHTAFLGQDQQWGSGVQMEGGVATRVECTVQDPAQHNHLLPRDFPSRLARAREERARFVSLSLRSWHVSVEATRAAPEAPLPQPRPSRRPARHACQCRDRAIAALSSGKCLGRARKPRT